MPSSNRSRSRRTLSVVALFATLLGPLAAPAAAEPSSGSRGGWTGAWATSMQEPFVGFGEPNWSVDGFADHSVRQVARVSTGGSAVRIRLSNVYGTKPMRVTGASIGKAGDGGTVRPGSLRPLTFRHSPATVIPAGREAVSDAAPLLTAPLDRLAVTVYFAEPTGPATFHLFSFEPTYRADGDHRFDASGAAFDETTQSFYYLTGVDVIGRHHARRDAVVAFGDSITDGAFSTPGADNRYPDELAERLVAAGRPLGVLNAGIGGNRLLDDSPCFGEKAVDRFPRDVLDEPRVRTVIVLDSTNDLLSMSLPTSECGAGHPDLTAADLIEGFRALIGLAHSRGIRIIGATVLPFKDDTYGLWTPEIERVRDGVNEWIRTGGEFDAVVDFDAVMSNPADPDQLRPEFDGGDRLHPNDAGFCAMAAAIDLSTL
ncbi:MAG TPA: SGNH/GDSL hydrolase family protein [Actinophytocola sp.]|uniref:SGNH/GDSL hydrolase family protein n=1 Tax=Actinophytocola sp. TaxID=1872138 RepID=UPI002DDD2266|nr:SGNH/GDSL hydrolase family protein [Actinophytocola sp.]HEV2782895.1 SGNH/GDSL hydrolase family protein [Actinophytocola sp.]